MKKSRAFGDENVIIAFCVILEKCLVTNNGNVTSGKK